MSFSINRNKSQLNSFSDTFNDGEFINGTYEKAVNSSLIEVTVTTDQEVNLYSYHSRDGVNSITSTSDVVGVGTTTIRIELKYKYFKLALENTSGALTTVTVNSFFTDEIPFRKPLSEKNINENDATLTKSILVGKSGSSYYPLKTDADGNLSVNIESDTATENLLNSDNGTFDAFYRQRISNPITVFDSKQIADKQPLFWDDQLVSGSGGATTYNSNQASTTLSVALNTAAVRVRQTFRRFNYQPGKSQLFIQTGIFGAAATGIKRKAGLFDSKNGIFFDQQSDGMGVTVRTYTSGSAVDTRVLQANWNIDKMDGMGTSGITLDFTKTLIWFADFEWLGVGSIRFGFFVNGRPYYVHKVNNANSNTLVYMSTPNLPLRYEIENTGTGAAAGFTHICSTVISEGGMQDTGYPFGVTRGATPLVTNNDTNIYPLIALRLNSSYQHALIKLLDFSLSCISTATYNYFLILNPTVTGTAFSFSQVTNSSLEVDVSRTSTTTVSGGTIIKVGTTSQTNEGRLTEVLNSDFALGSNIAGTSDIIVLAVQRVTGTSETFYGSLNWKDQQ